MSQQKNIKRRVRRKHSIRSRVKGTPDRPRLTVFRSNQHIYAQVIDDVGSTSLAAASTLTKDIKGDVDKCENKRDAAALVGKAIAEVCKARGIEKVVFDRNGYKYHGRVSALAEAAREAGLQF